MITSTGTVRDKYKYKPFGDKLSSSVQVGQAYRYTGKPLDEELDLDWYYYGARYYDPSTGRFLAVDPLNSKYPSWSPYVYCRDNPIRLIDPDGRASEGLPDPQYDQWRHNQKSNANDPVSTGQYVNQTAGKVVNNVATTVVETKQKVETAVVQGAQVVADKAVAGAKKMETPLMITGAVVGTAGAIAGAPAVVTVGTVLAASSLSCTYIRTGADPTPGNLTDAAIQTGLTLATAGAVPGLRALQATGRMTKPQAIATAVNAATGAAVVGQASRATFRTPSVSPTQSIPGLFIPSQ